MYELVLENGKNINFEELFMHALSLADVDAALQKKPTKAELRAEPRYWQNLFMENGYKELALTSAIIFELDLPFGAYVITRCEQDLIEIQPWLYSEQFNRERSLKEVFADDASAGDLRAFARSLLNTADYIEWLEEFQKTGRKP